MATRADIEINVKGLKKVQELSKELDKVSGKVNQLNKTGGSKTEKQAANFEEKRAASMVRVRNIGDQIQRAKEAGLKTDKASRALNRAALANERGKLKLSKAHQQVALKELGIEQKITNENLRQIKAKEREAKIEARNLARQKAQRGTKAALTSGAISGAFPLLFGQGPLGGAAGFAGGFIGTKLGGQMGGFAGGLVATAALQQIQTTITTIGELGQALNPLTADANRLVTALGLAGTAEAERIKLIEQVEGRQAALAAATENMALVIGDDGVDALKEFGSKFNDIQGNMSQFSLKLQSKFAKMFNAIIDRFPRIFGKSRTPKEEAAFTEKLEKDTTVIALGTEIERISKELLRLKSQRGDDAGFASGPSFIKGGSTLFPSQMPDLNEEVDTAVKNKELDKSIRIAEQQLNSAKKSLDIRKRDIDTIIKGNTAQKEAKDITDLILRSTRKNVTLLEAKRDGNLQEVETQQKVADIVQRIVDLGINKDLIDEEEIEKLVEKEQKLEALLSKTKDLGSNFERIGKSIASGVSDNLTAAIMQTKSLGDAAKSILNDLSSTLIRLGVNTILGGIAPGIFGGLPMLNFARGGRPPTGRPSLVGEKGPELFVPKRSGTIIPNDKLGGGSTNINVNIDASGSSVEGDEQQSKELGRAISAAIQSELLKQRRPGGLLR